MFRKITQSWPSISNNAQFLITNALYALLILGSTIYCYIRLDYSISYKTPKQEIPVIEEYLQPTQIQQQ